MINEEKGASMVKKQSSESAGIPEQSQNMPFTQKPTIQDAVTYIVDEQGNEIKQNSVVNSQKSEAKIKE